MVSWLAGRPPSEEEWEKEGLLRIGSLPHFRLTMAAKRERTKRRERERERERKKERKRLLSFFSFDEYTELAIISCC